MTMPGAETLAVTCYRRAGRTVTACLVAASRVSIVLVLARIVFVYDPVLTLRGLLGLVTTMIVAPGALAMLFARSAAADVAVEGDTVVLRRRDLRIEVPAAAIVAVEPWTVPLPTPGATLRLRSGSRLAFDLGLAEPDRLAAFLAARGIAAAGTERDAAAFRHAAASARAGTLRWWQWLLKFPLLGVLPTAVLFRADQWITYGGTFGEYYTYGARAYVLTFLAHWATVTTYLALFAGTWRVGGELLVWTTSRLAPRMLRSVRMAVEVACRLAYYGGVPALLALRFLE